MIGSWEIDELRESQQLFAFSRAYLKSSIALCSRIQRLRCVPRYPEATVVLFLARHAVETVFEGRDHRAYAEGEAGPRFGKAEIKVRPTVPRITVSWTLPFTTGYPGMTPAQISKAKKHTPPGEQVYRYPIDKAGAKWTGIFALEPRTFQRDMLAVGKEMTSLAQQISTANKAVKGTRRKRRVP